MIEQKKIEEIVSQELEGSEYFLVDLDVRKGNIISVFIDKQEGVDIQDCVQLTKAIEGKLDRDVEDFELQVSSPGLTKVFKVREQYLKNINEQVEVITFDGLKHRGKLLSFDEASLRLEKIPEGRKKEIETIELEFSDIKSTKLDLSF